MIQYIDVARNTALMLDTHIVLDTADKGLTQQFAVGTPSAAYDLTGCTIEFRVQTKNGTITGLDVALDADPTTGKFTITWPDSLYDHSLDSFQAVFLISKGGNVVDTTSRFWVTVQPTAGIIETVGRPAIDGIEESLNLLSSTVTSAQSAAKTQNDDATAAIAKIGPATADAVKGATDAATSANTAADAATKAAGTVDSATKAATDAANSATTAAGKATDAATGAMNATKAATDATTAANTAAVKADASATAADKIVTNAGDIADMETKTDANNKFVALDGDQTINGVKVFSYKPQFTNGISSGPFEVTPDASKESYFDFHNGSDPSISADFSVRIINSMPALQGNGTGGLEIYAGAFGIKLPSSDTATVNNQQIVTKDMLTNVGKVQGAVTADGKVLTIDSNGNLVLPATSTTGDIDAALTSYLKTADADKTYAKPADIATAIKAIPAPDLSAYPTTAAMNTAITAAKPDLSALESKTSVAADASKALGFNGLVANADEGTAQGATSDGKVYLVK